ncbi:MAG: DNA adenine methylase, partial [Bacteroidota bacterium]
GGKTQLINELEQFFPTELRSGGIRKYAEPFIGGGAVFFTIAQKYPTIESYFLSDINEELILAYRTIQRDVESVIYLLKKLEEKYYTLDETEQKDFYYNLRSAFNNKRTYIDFSSFNDDWIERTASIIFLNRTCYNGLFRVNSNGNFNVPFGDYKNPRICDQDNLLAVSKLLKKAEIVCGDFTISESFIDENTFVYFDPPYRPISKTSNFTSYSRFDFDEKEQIRLANYFNTLSQKGAKLMLSNSDPKNENPNDDFFENLYKGFRINRIEALRMINCNGNRRGKIKELVITNY